MKYAKKTVNAKSYIWNAPNKQICRDNLDNQSLWPGEVGSGNDSITLEIY